jgi:hypothetical protein
MYYFRLKKRPVHLDFDVLLCNISSLREENKAQKRCEAPHPG